MTTITPTAISMLHHVAKQIPELIRLVTSASYVIGMFFITMGIASLRHCGHSGQQKQGHQTTLQPILIGIFTGVCLMYLPSSMQVATATFFTNDSPISYVKDNVGQWMQFYNDMVEIIFLVGVISVIRGFFEIKSGHGQNSEKGHTGNIAKGMTHIIGGVFCCNIQLVVSVVLVTLGVTL